jgi:PKD repeat protein
MARARAIALLLSAAALWAGPGRAQTSTTQNPTYTFTTPGHKQVTLKACNLYGCSSVTQNLTVLDPRPVINSASVGASVVEAGQLVKLSGVGHGQPPLNYTWRVTSQIASEVDLGGSGAWWNTQGIAPGIYTVALHLQNGAGMADSAPFTVVVAPEVAKSFYTVTPCRILDTRQSNAVVSGVPVTFAAAGISAFACGIPAGAKAMSVNLTAVGATGPGFITLFPGDYPPPNASTLNFSTGQTRTNNAILQLSSDGSGTLAAQSLVGNGGSVQLIVDVNGYFM